MKTVISTIFYMMLMGVLSYQAFGPIDLQVYSAAPTQVELDGKSLYELPEYTESQDVSCLAENIYHEARNQSVDGMVAVASVTVNRVNSVDYPNTVCEVVHDPYQFSWVHDNMTININNSIDQKSWEVSKQIALMVLNDGVPHDMLGVYHYHADYVQPEWSTVKRRYRTIGNHVFYKSTI